MMSNRDQARTAALAVHRAIGACVVSLALVASYVGCGGHTTINSDNGASEDSGPGTAEDSGTIIGQADTGSVAVPDSGTHVVDSGTSAVDSGSSFVDAGHGAPSTTYPAFTPDVGQVVENGGSVVANPVIVTVTWSADPSAATYNAFGDGLGASTYWSDINSEYGVGPATSGAANHVSITTAVPTYFDDRDLDTFVEAHVGVDWPAQTANTLFAIYLPPGPTFYQGGPPPNGQDACAQGLGGYHTTSRGHNYVYAIMPACAGFDTDNIEFDASHELNEMATDPHPDSGWDGFDNNHLAFEVLSQFLGDEVGDLCEIYPGIADVSTYSPYDVQLQWSNRSAAAGHAWCVPAPNEPFYNTTVLPSAPLDTITANLSGIAGYFGHGTQTSKGLRMALNTTRTFPIGLFSDRDTNGPFTLTVDGLVEPIAYDYQGNAIANGAANVVLDLTSGVNGQIANVTVTPTAFSSLGVTYFYIKSTLASTGTPHYLPILISQN